MESDWQQIFLYLQDSSQYLSDVDGFDSSYAIF